MRRLVVITGLISLLLVTAVSAGNTNNAGQNNTGGSTIGQQPPQQTEDPNAQPFVPTESAPLAVPTQPVVIVPTQPEVPTQDTSSAQVSVPADPLTGVYCATNASLIRINGADAPPPAQLGSCVCVEAYGPHRLETGPDLYAGTDDTQPDFFGTSPDQCLTGMTIYQWSTGAYDAGTFVPNPNAQQVEPVTTEPETTTPAVSSSMTMMVDARSDLEMLASSTLGTDRPAGWSGSLDVTDPTLPLLLRLDLEILSDTLLGAGVRPTGWFGSVASTPEALTRDVRHDLELLATAHLGSSLRPDGWMGTHGDSLLLCNRATQTLINLLERGGVYTLTVDPNDPDFCNKAELSATTFSELNLLSSPADRPIFSSGAEGGGVTGGTHQVDTEFAVAFLDKGAALSVGVIPSGEPITPVGRSTSQFSRMTLVSGADFLVFVDYRDTTLTEDEFNKLPDAGEYGTEPFCSADWCGD